MRSVALMCGCVAGLFVATPGGSGLADAAPKAAAAKKKAPKKKGKTPAASTSTPPGVPITDEVVPLVPPPAVATPAPADAEPGSVTRIEAASADPAAAPTPLIVADAPPPTTTGVQLTVGPRGGAFVPFSFLRPGYVAGLEVRIAPSFLDRRVSVGLFAAFAQASGTGPRLVEGRGYDTAFIQNVSAVPLELTFGYEVWRDDVRALSAQAGYALWFTTARFEALGAQEERRGPGHTAVAGAAFRWRVGPGDLGAGVRMHFGGASWGPLSEVGTNQLTAVLATLSYAYSFSL